MHKNKKLDAVFEGGGVKAIALVGAVSVAEDLGYQFENLVGTSAGAIVAALIAAGYGSTELKDLIFSADFSNFEDAGWPSKIPLLGPFASLLTQYGIFEGNRFEKWIRDLLKNKNIVTFGDLVIPEYASNRRYRYKLQVVASDISRGKMLLLPTDLQEYGINPDEFPVARAVRMSMSIPYFFKPCALKSKIDGRKSYIVDGGLLSDFPLWALTDHNNPEPPWPTVGFKLVDPDEGKPHPIHGPLSLFAAIFSTMLEAHDARYIKESDFVRTIPIPTQGIQAIDFGLSASDKSALFQSGFQAAETFFAQWDFETYKKNFRQPVFRDFHRTKELASDIIHTAHLYKKAK